jgi:hypothetical protein
MTLALHWHGFVTVLTLLSHGSGVSLFMESVTVLAPAAQHHQGFGLQLSALNGHCSGFAWSQHLLERLDLLTLLGPAGLQDPTSPGRGRMSPDSSPPMSFLSPRAGDVAIAAAAPLTVAASAAAD